MIEPEVTIDGWQWTVNGLIERDYDKEPVGSVFDGYWLEDVEIKPREEWPDLIADQQRKKTSPLASHKYHAVPILNQSRTKYCWMYAVVAGVMNRLAHQGIDPVPHLSATACAAVGMGYKNLGGHCSRAVQMIQEQGGIPTVKAWPNLSMNRGLEKDPAVIESRAKNTLCHFTDLENNLDAAISVLLGDEPAPVTFSVPWWRHAILGLEVFDRGNAPADSLQRYGINFVNSYGQDWMNGGFASFHGDKMKAWEYVAIHAAGARTE